MLNVQRSIYHLTSSERTASPFNWENFRETRFVILLTWRINLSVDIGHWQSLIMWSPLHPDVCHREHRPHHVLMAISDQTYHRGLSWVFEQRHSDLSRIKSDEKHSWARHEMKKVKTKMYSLLEVNVYPYGNYFVAFWVTKRDLGIANGLRARTPVLPSLKRPQHLFLLFILGKALLVGQQNELYLKKHQRLSFLLLVGWQKA